jgi:serine/threonine-protein kinase
VLTDFTMARLREAACRRQEHPPAMLPAGTVAYASPEQITCGPEALSPASDIFSLGAVFYEMLTGKRLFPGEDPAVSRELVLRAVVAPPSAQTPGLPPAVDELCQRMLSRAASARLQTAAEIVQLAEGILA